jgi:hypothetical protein
MSEGRVVVLVRRELRFQYLKFGFGLRTDTKCACM